MAIRHSITLSTSEPNNEVGNLKIRQGDEQTQTLVANITENGVPKPFVGLQPFFCAKLGQTAGLGIIEQKVTGPMNPANGTLEYVMQPEDWQRLGRQTAYFSFRKMKNDHEWTEQFSTRDFNYNVTKSVFSEGIKETKKDGGTYVWTIEDMLRLFKEYMATGKTSWEEFVEQNREILESVDPGGKLIGELIDARKPFGEEAYATLGDRLDASDMQLSQTVKKGDLIVDVRDFGAKGDYNHVTRMGLDNTVAFNTAIASLPSNGGTLIIPSGNYLIPNDGIVIDKPITIIGDGAGTYDSGGTRIFTHSPTANLFTLTKGGTVVSGIAFINNSSTRPTAGSAILCTDFDWGRIERCLFRGFWNNVQVDSGYFYSIRDSAFLAPVNYGCYMRNTAPGQHDHGDQVLEGCNFSKYGDPIDGGTAVRWESGGGLRIIGCKVNAGTQPGYTNTGFFDNGFVTVMQPGGTSVHTITGCSVEGWKTYGISISGTVNAAFGKISITGNEFLASGSGGSCIHADGKDMIALDSIVITGNVGYGPSGGVMLYNLTEVVYTGNNWAGCTQSALTISGVTSLIQGDNLWKSNIFDLDGSSEVYSDKIGNYRGDWVWGYELVNQSGTSLVGKVSPGKHSTLILTIRVYGNIATKGGVILEQRRAISRALGNASVTQTVGTDLDIGAGSGELLIEYDTTTSPNYVIPKVTTINGKLFNGAVEITVNGMINALYYV